MSFPHLVVIALVALILLGPEKLPQVARMMGKAMAEFRRITGDFRSTVEGEIREMERATAMKEMRADYHEPAPYDADEARRREAVTAAAAASQDPVLPPVTVPEHGAAPAPAPTPTLSETPGATETHAAAASGKPSDGQPPSV